MPEFDVTPRPRDPAPTPPLTKIVATLGPASDAAAVIARLIDAGVGIFRLNFSHGDLDGHAARVERIRAAARQADRPVAILGDLQGPRIRTGPAPEGGIALETGMDVCVSAARGDGGSADLARREIGPGGAVVAHVTCTYGQFVSDVEPGHRILIADGTIRFLVVAREALGEAPALRCTVMQGGTLTSAKGINCPDSNLGLETITDRDREHVRWAVEHDIDLLALSFVRTADDVRQLRRIVQDADPDREPLPIVAKIEVPRAVREIDDILDASDGIMIARGDLGVEMDFALVPVVQKRLILAAYEHGRPCIVATQMLESMIHAATPTRAEATDVAAAIFDGADAVMLSGETAIGAWPQLAVEAMARIGREAEAFVRGASERRPPARPVERRSHGAALAHGVAVVARDLEARCVVVWSQSGNTARYLSHTVRGIPIVAVSSDRRAARRMQLLRGVRPLCLPVPESFSAFTAIVDRYVREAQIAQPGDRVVVVAGEPLGTAGVTNSLAMHVVDRP